MKNTDIKYMFRTFNEITPEVLRELGLKAVAVDVDNTTVYDSTFHVIEGAIEWIESLKNAGIKVALVTNTPFFRAYIFGKVFGVPFNAYSSKPHTRGIRHAAKVLGVELTEIGMVGDQVFTDVAAANKCGAVPLLVDPVENKKFWKNHYKKAREKETPLRRDFLWKNGYYVTKPVSELTKEKE